MNKLARLRATLITLMCVKTQHMRQLQAEVIALQAQLDFLDAEIAALTRREETA